ncbi:hypothetical protein GCM10009554_43940 [Kribbella koreensis]|uniref:GAF domain-containing protein n=1 Tax=Kribbella koreensis TaxID=57909 RepID=A0ABN1QTP2_9ACTN
MDGTAESLVRFAAETAGCTSAGLALNRQGALQLAAVTDPRLEPIYRFKFATGEGPLVTAFTYDTIVRVRDVGTDPRWPIWSERIAATGVRSVLQAPLRVGGRIVGVLGFYSSEPDAFSAEVEAIAADAEVLEVVRLLVDQRPAAARSAVKG